ncbi:MAG: bacterial Ig-like domain-containing protein, partial [Candidatus Pacebacteria bacterium]|nr:bacterial Ig-like domain-containing protein [Candidatus Paceibacterota bacterium]
PAKPFNIRLGSDSEERGPQYSIGYDGTYIMLPGSVEGEQLQSTTSKNPHPWRINRYSSFCTIRDYDNQKLLVVAEGSTGGGNTTVIGKSSQGSAPDNGKIVFFREVSSDGAKTTVQVKTYPKKTTYALGEGFDTTGVLAVLQSGGTEKDISGSVSFYTSKTVQLTQGRPFTTTGKKVVEIRYNGEKIAEYTIIVQ